jgi:predicted transcriptional regulator
MGQDASTTYISARVPTELVEAFCRVAETRDRSRSAELREAMRRHVAATSEEAAPVRRLAEDRVVTEPEHVEA